MIIDFGKKNYFLNLIIKIETKKTREKFLIKIKVKYLGIEYNWKEIINQPKT